MAVITISDGADPRLDDYRALKEARLNEQSGKFVAESEVVVRKLLASGLHVHSVLLTPGRLRSLQPALTGDYPVYVVPQTVMDGVAGLPVHRGCLAIGARPVDVTVPADARLVVVLADLVDVDNVGAIARNAAAFGADALLLSPRCADPFYRKAIRVSAGCVFALPVVRASRWPDDLLALRNQRGFSLLAATLDTTATPLPAYQRPPRVALVLGSEGPGLSPQIARACDATVTIPMAGAIVDSLNVATAAAVFLYQLTRAG